MLRTTLNEALKTAMRDKDAETVGTVRLILAALKDKDIAARPSGNSEGISEPEILSMLQGMIKQRRESISMYRQGGREELAQKEEAEIRVIERFLPQQMGEEEVAAAIEAAIAATGASGLRDMGKVMAELKARHAGQMDFTQASAAVKGILGG